MKKTFDVFCCPECGSTNIQIMAWVNPNNGRYCSAVNDPLEEDDTWCEDCEEHTGVITLSELREIFSELPTNSNGKTEEDFLRFKAGTDQQDILRWFEQQEQ